MWVIGVYKWIYVCVLYEIYVMLCVNFILKFLYEVYFMWINVRYRIGCDVLYLLVYLVFLGSLFKGFCILGFSVFWCIL